MSFSERMHHSASVRRLVEAVTAPTEWRFLNARFGKCAGCHRKFMSGEVCLWHLRTKDTMHPECASLKYHHLTEWIETATHWKRRGIVS